MKRGILLGLCLIFPVFVSAELYRIKTDDGGSIIVTTRIGEQLMQCAYLPLQAFLPGRAPLRVTFMDSVFVEAVDISKFTHITLESFLGNLTSSLALKVYIGILKILRGEHEDLLTYLKTLLRAGAITAETYEQRVRDTINRMYIINQIIEAYEPLPNRMMQQAPSVSVFSGVYAFFRFNTRNGNRSCVIVEE